MSANKKVKSQDLTLYGNVVRSEVRGDFRLVETTFAEDAEVPMHSHERPYVSFLLRGSYTEEVRRHCMSARPGR